MAQPVSRLPLYAQVEEALAAQIADGTYSVGAQLPPEDELIRLFGVSRTTVRTTINNLVRQGLLEIRRGRGTFVSSPRIVQDLSGLTGFVEDMEALGRTASARVLERRIVPANSLVSVHLCVPEGADVVRIRRVRLSNGSPLSLDDTFLPEPLGRRVMADDLSRHPIFTLLEERYGTPLIEAEIVFESMVADAEIADALDIELGGPLFVIERTSYTTGGRPVDYERLHYRGDQIRFRTRLIRRPPPKSAAGGVP